MDQYEKIRIALKRCQHDMCACGEVTSVGVIGYDTDQSAVFGPEHDRRCDRDLCHPDCSIRRKRREDH